MRRHLDACPTCGSLSHRVAAIADRAPALLGECPSSCSHELMRQLFDRWSRTTAGGLDFWVAFSERGLTEIVPVSAKPFDNFVWDHERRTGKELRAAELPERLGAQLEEAASGHGVGAGQPEVDLAWMPPFERVVLQALLEIPDGELRSYAWVAREVGKPKAVRAVGNACARNPVPVVVPCHRVVPAAGGIGHYAFGADMKRELLDREGVDLGLVGELERRGARYVAPGGGYYCFPTCGSLRGMPRHELEPVRDEREAAERGLVPCDECRPLEAER